MYTFTSATTIKTMKENIILKQIPLVRERLNIMLLREN